ncbi:hypothetical protein ACIQCG_24070 [Streptomyces noursei]|uniref:hypothetical protein n=1 Tax=Streptomyces noursei TaxID=1971 RepID=UPI003809AA46
MLEAGLPPGALAGTGGFAERAAARPREDDALLLATHLLTRPCLPPRTTSRSARPRPPLLPVAEALLPAHGRLAAMEQLCQELVDVGEVDMAQAPTAVGWLRAPQAAAFVCEYGQQLVILKVVDVRGT